MSIIVSQYDINWRYQSHSMLCTLPEEDGWSGNLRRVASGQLIRTNGAESNKPLLSTSFRSPSSSQRTMRLKIRESKPERGTLFEFRGTSVVKLSATVLQDRTRECVIDYFDLRMVNIPWRISVWVHRDFVHGRRTEGRMHCSLVWVRHAWTPILM